MIEQTQYSTTNLYQGVRGLAIKILNRVDRTDAYLDKLLDIEIKNSELSGQDKALLFEIVHGVIRWLSKIDWVLNGFYKGQFSKCIPTIKNSMRVALYQILYLDRIPDYAAVNESVEFIKRLQGKKPADLVNAVLRNIIRNKDGIRYPDIKEDIVGYYSVYYSHPSWLVKRWLNRFGEPFTEKLLAANNLKPSLTLRVNQLKTNPEEFYALLDSVKLNYIKAKYIPGFVRLTNLTNITDWKYFELGYFGLQDESTAFPCTILDVKPGMRVLDLCAAPGGKTGILADIMKNTGEIVAIDKYESRQKILSRNLERLGVTNYTPIVADALEYQAEPFDRILIDAPCSGMGTLTKKPDIKWKRDLGDIRKLAEIQFELLKKGASLLNHGGLLVYNTCTIEPEENIEVVKKFLFEFPEYKLDKIQDPAFSEFLDENGCLQTFPYPHELDGTFSARIIKK